MRLSPLDQYYIQEAASVFSLRLCGAISLLNPDAPLIAPVAARYGTGSGSDRVTGARSLPLPVLY